MTDDAPVLHAGVGGATKCKSCEATIIFAKTITGALAPFERHGHGQWGMTNGVAHFLGKLPAPAKVALYKRHVCEGATRG